MWPATQNFRSDLVSKTNGRRSRNWIDPYFGLVEKILKMVTPACFMETKSCNFKSIKITKIQFWKRHRVWVLETKSVKISEYPVIILWRNNFLILPPETHGNVLKMLPIRIYCTLKFDSHFSLLSKTDRRRKLNISILV